MNNPYQLIGYVGGNTQKGVVLGSFDKHGQAVAEMLERKADSKNIYTEFRIAKTYHWQITVFKKNGQIDFCGYHNTKAKADEAYARLVQLHSTVEMIFIGGISDDE